MFRDLTVESISNEQGGGAAVALVEDQMNE